MGLTNIYFTKVTYPGSSSCCISFLFSVSILFTYFFILNTYQSLIKQCNDAAILANIRYLDFIVIKDLIRALLLYILDKHTPKAILVFYIYHVTLPS